MKISNVSWRLLLSVMLSLSTSAGSLLVAQQTQPPAAATERAQAGGSSAANTSTSAAAQVLERNVRAHMEFLASDAMQGRGSGTQFELLAGQYIASQLRQYGVEPAGDASAAGQKSFIQTVALTRQAFADAPALTFNGTGGAQRRWVHGKELLVGRVGAAQLSGALQKLRAGERPAAGAVVVLAQEAGGGDMRQLFSQASALGQQGAAAVVVAENETLRRNWATQGARLPQLPLMAGAGRGAATILILSTDAFKELQAMPDGTPVNFGGTLSPAQTSYTWNVVGVLPGSDAKLSSEAVLLSAHMDHIGVGTGQTGDQIYNGADDDASGVVAVLELARALGAGARPKRTTYFVLFGSEEKGGHGAQYFLSNPPVALTQMVANLEFEMIGRPDPKVAADTLWLTGYERSNLGAELAMQGARLVADPHPDQNFFQRSDNYALARRGVVAHTVSSFGLHPEYHQPGDDIAHIDFPHMTRAINSMVAPVLWLVNSNFTPTWAEGKKP
jgi:aminopeptidase YwaD